MKIEVVFARPRKTARAELDLAEGSTVGDALQAIRAADGVREIPVDEASAVSVWGEIAEPAQILVDGDRVELLRPLCQSPMEWRRRNISLFNQESSESDSD